MTPQIALQISTAGSPVAVAREIAEVCRELGADRRAIWRAYRTVLADDAIGVTTMYGVDEMYAALPAGIVADENPDGEVVTFFTGIEED